MIVGRRERGCGMDLEEDAAALARLVVDARQALLDQIAAGGAAGEFGFELEKGGHGPDRLRPKPPMDLAPFRGVEMVKSMTYQSVREPFQLRLIRRSRSALRNPHVWAQLSDVSCRRASLSHVAGQVEHTARRGRDRTGRRRRLDRARCGRGREAHQGAGGAGGEAPGHHADLLSRVGRAAHHRRHDRGRRAKAPAARSSSCCCSTQGKLWVGTGSDHTDREVEKYGVTVSKQMCEKPMAPAFWAYDDVAPHWDRLMLRAHVIEGRQARALPGRARSPR